MVQERARVHSLPVQGCPVYLQRTVVRWRQCSSIVQNTRLLLLSVLQPVITHRELKWKSVTKNVTPHSALFVQCFWSLMFFLWFVVLSIPHLFRPTCRPISNQQMYMSSASSDALLGYLGAGEKPSLSKRKCVRRRTHLWNYKLHFSCSRGEIYSECGLLCIKPVLPNKVPVVTVAYNTIIKFIISRRMNFWVTLKYGQHLGSRLQLC